MTESAPVTEVSYSGLLVRYVQCPDCAFPAYAPLYSRPLTIDAINAVSQLVFADHIEVMLRRISSVHYVRLIRRREFGGNSTLRRNEFGSRHRGRDAA